MPELDLPEVVDLYLADGISAPVQFENEGKLGRAEIMLADLLSGGRYWRDDFARWQRRNAERLERLAAARGAEREIRRRGLPDISTRAGAGFKPAPAIEMAASRSRARRSPRGLLPGG